MYLLNENCRYYRSDDSTWFVAPIPSLLWSGISVFRYSGCKVMVPLKLQALANVVFLFNIWAGQGEFAPPPYPRLYPHTPFWQDRPILVPICMFTFPRIRMACIYSYDFVNISSGKKRKNRTSSFVLGQLPLWQQPIRIYTLGQLHLCQLHLRKITALGQLSLRHLPPGHPPTPRKISMQPSIEKWLYECTLIWLYECILCQDISAQRI